MRNLGLIGLTTMLLGAAPLAQAQQPAAGGAPNAGAAVAPAQTRQAPVSALVRAEVMTADGKLIGTVDRLVERVSDRQLFAVVSNGGLLGFAQKQVILPLMAMEMAGQQLRLTGLSQPDIAQLPEWKSNNPDFRSFFGEATIREGH